MRLALALLAGIPWNAAGDVEFRQDGHPPVSVRADWESRPFESPWYYAVRVAAGAWSLELLHDKIYLRDPPADVQSFAVSHGLNLVTAQRAWDRSSFEVRLGAGVVVAHPESTVRGRELSRYALTGPVVGGGLGRRFRLGDRVWGDVEARATAARVHVPIAGGEARTTSLALHFLVGLGIG